MTGRTRVAGAGAGTRVTRLVRDLVLGVRLSVAGGRRAWTRLALVGVGIGVGVAVLLGAASAHSAVVHRDARQAARAIETPKQPVTTDPLYLTRGATEFRGASITGKYLTAGGPTAPLPPGVARLPEPGETVVSPALAELLASPEGELLRPRFPHVIGTIADEGLIGPGELLFYGGAGGEIRQSQDWLAVYRFGSTSHDPGDVQLPLILWLLLVVGIVVLLFPVLVFVGICTRLASDERDRRLAALRMIGAGRGQVRLIASGEALAGAVVGLAVGAVLFLVGREFVDEIDVMGVSFFPDDLVPAWQLVLLIALLVPTLAVVTAVATLRRTVVEPLGVLRTTGRRARRRLWWRLVPPALGAAVLLVSGVGQNLNSTVFGIVTRLDATALVVGVALLLLTVPLLLPLLLEWAVARWRPGLPSWQLAVRRLQLDSGTPSRVVAGLAVVLAGAITGQALLAYAETTVGFQTTARTTAPSEPTVEAWLAAGAADQVDAVADQLGAVEGVSSASGLRVLPLYSPAASDLELEAYVGSCAALATQARLPSCQDGDVFRIPRPYPARGGPRPTEDLTAPGATVRFFTRNRSSTDTPETRWAETRTDGPEWTVPAGVRPAEERPGRMVNAQQLLITPGALAGVATRPERGFVVVDLAPASLAGLEDTVERVRNALAPLGWQASVSANRGGRLSENDQFFLVVRGALLAGALLTLLVAAASLLVLALDQVRERRRALAVLAASGVPRGTLARSLLWQHTVPVLVAVLVAVATGTGLGALLLGITGADVVFDWAGVGVLSAATAVTALAVTALTLPALRRATTAEGLRTE